MIFLKIIVIGAACIPDKQGSIARAQLEYAIHADSVHFSCLQNEQTIVVVRYLNTFLHVCPNDILDPFNSEWKSFEDIALYSLRFKITAFETISKEFITVGDIRNGSERTVETKFDISLFSENFYCLGYNTIIPTVVK